MGCIKLVYGAWVGGHVWGLGRRSWKGLGYGASCNALYY